MQLCQTLLLFVLGTFVNAAEYDCISGVSYLYSGDRSFTQKGIECQRWDEKSPHTPRHIPHDGGHHNFCRNPDKDIGGTWCYTTDPKVRWDYCKIPKCRSEAVMMWNSFDESTNSSFFSEVLADPEYMSEKREKSAEEPEEDHSTIWENAEFKAFAANYEKKLLYFTDIRGNYFGIYDMETKAMEKFLHGMVEDIEGISYDSVTNNFYWTDSKMNWVVAAEPTLQSYTPIYKPSDGHTPYAIEVHSVKRLLIFSTYLRKSPEEIGAKIISTDLAGRNEKVLFSYPDVVKVVGLTIDYTEDRIYWTENIGEGSKVLSSRVDGTDKQLHYAADESSYSDVAVYSDYIYISDARKRYNFFGDLRYHVQVITKRSNQVAHYKVNEKPMGIAPYDKNAHASVKPRGPGECVGTCDGICLPTLKGKRRCACSIGYFLQKKTNKCITKLIEDEYLLVADVHEGHAYQISLESDEESSIVPLGKASRVTSVAVDASSKFAYFADSRSGYLNRGILDNGLNVPLAKSAARAIEIDPLTGNVFYSDGKTIIVSNRDGSIQKVIVKPEMTNVLSDIKTIALDIKKKYIYWTDTLSQQGSGKLMRSRFDGSGKEIVLDNLNSPHGVAVDIQTNKLYLVESDMAVVYELPLAALFKIKSTSVLRPAYKKYNLRTSVKSKSSKLTEIKVHNGIAYIVDESQPRVQKLDLRKQPDLVGFGPATFYKAASLSIYSQSTYNNLIKSLPSPCATKSCALCVDITRQQAKCLGLGKRRKASG